LSQSYLPWKYLGRLDDLWSDKHDNKGRPQMNERDRAALRSHMQPHAATNVWAAPWHLHISILSFPPLPESAAHNFDWTLLHRSAPQFPTQASSSYGTYSRPARFVREAKAESVFRTPLLFGSGHLRASSELGHGQHTSLKVSLPPGMAGLSTHGSDLQVS
jgi:hypothetical protein